jgi:neurotransmitter:Na+ symporter, NSS family
MKIPRFFLFVMKYIAPIYLLVVLIGFAYSNFGAALSKTAGDPVALWTLVIIVAVLGLLVAVLVAGERRWRDAGLDIDGNLPPEGGYRS